jgi:hypothetical protein
MPRGMREEEKEDAEKSNEGKECKEKDEFQGMGFCGCFLCAVMQPFCCGCACWGMRKCNDAMHK